MNLDDYRAGFIPTATSGEWSIFDFHLSESDVLKQRTEMALFGIDMINVPAGVYTGLFRGNDLENAVMSDTPDELQDCVPFVKSACGHVLVGGLGLGCVLRMLSDQPQVTELTVVEQSADVLRLVWPYVKTRINKPINVYHASIFDWAPPEGVQFDCAWFDIWDRVVAKNLPEMSALRAKFAPHVKGLVECWCEVDCEKIVTWRDARGL